MPAAGPSEPRNLSPLIRAWEQHYRANGFTSQRMRGIAYRKANAGKVPPHG